MNRFISPLVFLALLGVLFIARPVLACPMCKEAVPASSDGVLTAEEQEAIQQAKAWNNSIYLFVSMPYLLVGGVGFLVYRGFKKAQQGQPAEPSANGPEPSGGTD
jgi:hypothetical protein